MPHLTLEYTANLPGLDVRQALVTLNAALMDSGHFEGPDIKSRALRLDDNLVGDGTEAGAFAHVTLRLLSGRTSDVKAKLASRLLGVLRHSVGADGVTLVQLTVEVSELERASYAKVTLTRARGGEARMTAKRTTQRDRKTQYAAAPCTGSIAKFSPP